MIELQGIERRTTAVETAQNETTQTLKWVVARIGRMSAVQDEHTLRLERIENDLTSLRRELPGMIAEVMREVLKEHDA